MERSRIGVFALAALAAGGLAWGVHYNSVGARLERASELVFERKYEEAVAAYRAIVAGLDPDEDREGWVEAHARLGEITYLELSEPRRAAEIYRRLIATAPQAEESWTARERLAEIARGELDDVHDAIAQWEALARSGRPNADRFALKIARAYFSLGDYEQCRQEAQALAERSPGGRWTADALFLLATAFQMENRHDEAVAAFEVVESRYPDTAVAARSRYQIGQSKASQRDWEGAQAALLAALETHPDPWRVQADLARVRKHLAELRKMRPLTRNEALAH
ncbi:tetratricopeptide repeat protein [Vulgatibacter sp.]|uniref:tetratricopeptide repeat protein n=1 Tax=Vulgatibacter sp. TaxID=1971226 RepID=UPI003565BB9E